MDGRIEGAGEGAALDGSGHEAATTAGVVEGGGGLEAWEGLEGDGGEGGAALEAGGGQLGEWVSGIVVNKLRLEDGSGSGGVGSYGGAGDGFEGGFRRAEGGFGEAEGVRGGDEAGGVRR